MSRTHANIVARAQDDEAEQVAAEKSSKQPSLKKQRALLKEIFWIMIKCEDTFLWACSHLQRGTWIKMWIRSEWRLPATSDGQELLFSFELCLKSPPPSLIHTVHILSMQWDYESLFVILGANRHWNLGIFAWKTKKLLMHTTFCCFLVETCGGSFGLTSPILSKLIIK